MNGKIKEILNLANKVDKRTIKWIEIGNIIGYIVSLIGIIILSIEYKKNISLEFYYIGIEVFKLGLIIAIGFVVIGMGLGIIKEMMKNG